MELNRGMRRLLAVAMLCSATASALARQAELIDLPYHPLQASGDAPLTVVEVEAAIREGARRNGWEVALRPLISPSRRKEA